jgi:cellulose synthase/poly-beta-1,6-N-acetylglucosamine synthase-like glycosyltransferase
MYGVGQGRRRHQPGACERAVKLPTLALCDVIAACRALRPEELVTTLRQRHLPVRAGAATFTAISDSLSHAAASKSPYPLAGQIPKKDLLLALQKVFGRGLIARATLRLAMLHPSFSARMVLSLEQKALIIIVAIFAALAVTAAPPSVFNGLALVLALTFLAGTGFRLWAVTAYGRRRQPRRRLTNAELPVYTVLAPLFRELRVLPQLIGALRRLDYPAEKLDIKLILEEEDLEMRGVLNSLTLPAQFEVIVVPKGKPQTKPRALSYALYFARGALVTVFDAEDIPEPQQLRVAAEIFAAAPPRLACLQARLAVHDANQNWLSQQFAMEYAALFDVLLPALGQQRFPLPLGGTSNHFRIEALRAVGAWDPFNVTEDADLGLRLARCGFRTDVFESTTYEEANGFLKGWMRQRCRWLKGWMQTAIVHLGTPRVLYRDLGASDFAATVLLLFGMVVSPVFHPLLLGMALWLSYDCVMMPEGPFVLSSLVAGFAWVVFISGYAAGFACLMKGVKARRLGRRRLAIATLPLYWLLISAAAWLALWELFTRPHHWHKTEHGLSCSRRKTKAWSGRWGSNPRHQAWEACVLPLNYARGAKARKQ